MSVTRISRAVFKQIRFTSFRVAPASVQTLSHRQTINKIASRRNFSVFSKSPDYSEAPVMDLVTFETKSSGALEALTDYFDELVESDPKLSKADVAYSVRIFLDFIRIWSNVVVILGRSVDSEARWIPGHICD